MEKSQNVGTKSAFMPFLLWISKKQQNYNHNSVITIRNKIWER